MSSDQSDTNKNINDLANETNMVHQHGAGDWRCPKCRSKHVDADEVKGKLVHYCMECGYHEGNA